MYISLLPFGMHFGACWRCERCLAGYITLRLTVRLSRRIVWLSKWSELWRRRVKIGCNIWHWLNWPLTVLWWSWLVCHLRMLCMYKGYECWLTNWIVCIRYRLHKPGRKFVTWFSIVCCRRRHTSRSMLTLDVGKLNMQWETRSCCRPKNLDCMIVESFMTVILVHLLYLNVLIRLHII